MSDPAMGVISAFYRALAARDPNALSRLLDQDVQATFAAGLPHRWGGLHRGRDAVLRTWGEITAVIDLAPRADEVVHDGERTMVIGEYVGSFVTDPRPFRASFVHLLRIADGRITEIRQVTDTAAWYRTAAPQTENDG